MTNILVVSGHPNLAESNTNTVIIESLEQQLDNLEVRKLHQLYPDYQIDVGAEQAALIKADIVVLQFPFYWYSTPALLKKWLDDVFSYNFAYGAKGDKLKGKDLILSFTIGGPKDSYQPLGYNHFTIELLILPLQQTAYLAEMNFAAPIYTHGMVYIPGVYNELEDVQNLALDHSHRLIEQINQLAGSAEQKVAKFVNQWFADFDVLADDENKFLAHLSDDIRMVMPDGEFIGHEGFRDWYAIARATFKPNCEHIVEQLIVTENDKQNAPDGVTSCEAQLRIRLKADTYPDSALKGESINMLVNETWQLTLDDSGHVTISDYVVEVLS
ncbi:NAD(P)H-dependent oxidoreductase [Endozoicomonas sp. G2_1]|uniref:NAD(P)H-dependent oxidoreductase n=1 Tax=Endozoicomonas sp. G2_1 TaxID=2821091 RepID=UPI001ADD5F62|nr:NAD(P)H-dependent oxidoreductase [Endozoicomonas sp. G2_1]MBO9491622.1 NAD(P)H-dependent oxidoreductase [Endozoicomonas sp. G2_1]